MVVLGLPGSPKKYKDISNDQDGRRKRKASANRALSILKAALNLAYQDERVLSDESWRRVKPFSRVDEAKVRYLNNDESRRLINACDPDFRLLVQAALLTGCRYGELTAFLHRAIRPVQCGSFLLPSIACALPGGCP